MSDEWRVEVNLDEERHGFTLGERLRSLDLDDEARERLGDRVVVTRDGPKVFLYAGSGEQAREAESVVRDLIASEGLSADVRVTRWHPDAEAWEDADVPLPRTDAEREAEQEAAAKREARASSEPAWEVRVDLPSLRATRDLAERLSDEGLDVHRRWKYLLVRAPTEERAAELAERIRAEAPEGADAHVEPSSVTHPAFVFLGAHAPGITRDLGR
jgi:hypothetical protein